MYFSNIINDHMKTYKTDNPFLLAFACFIDRLPNSVFGFRNKRREIVNLEVLQVIKVLFEGQTRRPACVAFLRMLYTKLMNSINRDKMLPLLR